MRLEDLKAYEIVEKKEIESLNSTGYVLKHIKTGARVAVLENDDENKVFSIGFRTTPTDSTGVAHIVEHTVLCGSESFPVKDPFIELAKGSLNTFLNAMTFPDKTIYPVASCNDKDFQNLMHVYLDAVFYPNIHKEEKIFKQEGWHYEMESAEDELKINGVVYSEMKGAFSSPDDVFEREIMNSLYPDVTYGVESGGDPDVIPELTYEQFCDFHKKFYHPSNSYIYLYGDCDMAEKLTFIDEQYLSKFDYLKVDSEITLQPAFSEVRKTQIEYPITEDESEEEKAYFSYNTVTGADVDALTYQALSVLSYVICGAPGSALKKALVDKELGRDVYSGGEAGIRQPYFSIVSKEVDESRLDEFLDTIKTVLKDMITSGIDKKSLLACITSMEFKYREADFGRYPKGLMYCIQMLESWLYDDARVFDLIDLNDTFAKLKELVETNYYEELIDKYILNNTHASIVTAVPKKGLTTKKENELKEKLATYKASLTKEQIEKIVADTKALKEYQDSEDSIEDLEKIPLLKLSDIDRTVKDIKREELNVSGSTFLHHDLFTNGIGYVSMMFDCKDVPVELLKYSGLLVALIGKLDTAKFTYGDLYDEGVMYTGGASNSFDGLNKFRKLDELTYMFSAKFSALYENMDKAFDITKEVLFNTSFEDKKRIKDVIKETLSQMEGAAMGSGHALANARVNSYYSKLGVLNQYFRGIDFLRLLEDLDKNFDEKIDDAIIKMQALLTAVLRPENVMFAYTGDKKSADIIKRFEDFKTLLHTEDYVKNTETIVPVKKNEAFKTSGKVQYVAKGGNFIQIDPALQYTGSFKVLSVMMGYDYLWNNIRVKGGAYGCMSNYNSSGNVGFVSYRDPNLTKTIEVYDGVADYLADIELDDRSLLQFIIGAISDEDVPLSPKGKGEKSVSRYIAGVDISDVNNIRAELLDTTVEDIRALAPYIKAALSEEYLCVVGSESEIEANKELFLTVENLIQ